MKKRGIILGLFVFSFIILSLVAFSQPVKAGGWVGGCYYGYQEDGYSDCSEVLLPVGAQGKLLAFGDEVCCLVNGTLDSTNPTCGSVSDCDDGTLCTSEICKYAYDVNADVCSYSPACPDDSISCTDTSSTTWSCNNDSNTAVSCSSGYRSAFDYCTYVWYENVSTISGGTCGRIGDYGYTIALAQTGDLCSNHIGYCADQTTETDCTGLEVVCTDVDGDHSAQGCLWTDNYIYSTVSHDCTSYTTEADCTGDSNCYAIYKCVPCDSTETDCGDGIDNDCDGDIDSADSDCQEPSSAGLCEGCDGDDACQTGYKCATSLNSGTSPGVCVPIGQCAIDQTASCNVSDGYSTCTSTTDVAVCNGLDSTWSSDTCYSCSNGICLAENITHWTDGDQNFDDNYAKPEEVTANSLPTSYIMLINNTYLQAGTTINVYERNDGNGNIVLIGSYSASQISGQNAIYSTFIFNETVLATAEANDDDDFFNFTFETEDGNVVSKPFYIAYETGTIEECGAGEACWVDSSFNKLDYKYVDENEMTDFYNNGIFLSGIFKNTSAVNMIFSVFEDDETSEGGTNIFFRSFSGEYNATGSQIQTNSININCSEVLDAIGGEAYDEANASNNPIEPLEFRFEIGGVDSNILNLTFQYPPKSCGDDPTPNYCKDNAITLCKDYGDPVNCSRDDCVVAENGITGTDPNTRAECDWNYDESRCYTKIINRVNGTDIGWCSYQETEETSCEDGNGFLTYSWTADWVWDDEQTEYVNMPACESAHGVGTCVSYIKPEGDTVYYYDPQRASEACKPGQATVACPASVQLDFFTAKNIFAALLLIALVYAIIRYSKKTQKKGSKKKK